MKTTDEHAFESYVEEILLTKSGWTRGALCGWHKELALFPAQVCAFITATQPKLWADMRSLHGAALEPALIAALVKELDAKGSLHVLRHGFKFYGKLFRLSYAKPAHGANFDTIDLFNKNGLTVTRQVPCHPGDTRTLDMLLAVNGLPVATIELKNPGTGQSWKNAVCQYKADRDPRAPLFAFKRRALVHFAADPDEVHMTTRLAGDKTHFLPFNRGSHPGEIICGKGNPQHPSGYRTGYFWEEVLERGSFLDILHDVRDAKVYDCVVVITDRQVLDRQLQDAIYQIEHAQGVVKAIDQDAKQLAAALVDGTKIVVTTLQKFPFVLRGLLHAAGAQSAEEASDEEKRQAKAWEAEIAKRRYAVIVDEAHSSQTGETARELKEILGKSAKAENGEEEADWEDRLNQVMQSRGRQPNLSFFAFTATPKGKTLELFGRTGANGIPEAFHLYSMRQAIEEGFILDVVTHYTTYKNFYRLVKAIENDPTLPRKKAAKALAKFMSLHPVNIEQKTEIMVEHFRSTVRGLLHGRAKAMVVTPSRLHAVRYMQAFQRYISSKSYSDIRPLVAFSGTVKDSDTGMEYTEPNMNLDCVSGKPVSERQLPERFASSDYQVLLVANKYQTGFDQPLLCAMYVDKRLDGVQAVQTLSRLNRKIREGDPEGVKSPTDVGTGTSKDVKAPLSEIIQALNDRFGTSFSEEDRIFFEQIREKAARNQQVIDTAKANPLDKFQLGIKQIIADLMIQRLGENDQIVSRYMEDAEFQNTAFPLLAQAIFESIRERT